MAKTTEKIPAAEQAIATTALVVRGNDLPQVIPTGRVVLTRCPSMPALAGMQTAFAEIGALTVDRHPQAKQLLDHVRAARREAEAFHANQKRPINAVRDVALDLEKQDVSAWKKLETQIGSAILDFEREVERQRKAEEDRRLREKIAAEQAAAQQKAADLKAAAKETDDPATAKALRQQAKVVAATPTYIPTEAFAVASPIAASSTRKTYRAEIADLDALVLAVAAGILARRLPIDDPRRATALDLIGPTSVSIDAIEPARLVESHPYLDGWARNSKGELTLPGVVAVEKTGLSGR